MNAIVIWVTDRSTGEDGSLFIDTDRKDIEQFVSEWIERHPEFEVTGWDYR